MIKEFDDFFNSGKKIDVRELKVPEYVNFINDWRDFTYPTGHVIFDKSICGCGFTEYCLGNIYPTILCSPRKILLENKIEQHKDDLNMYYFRNERDSSVSNYDTEIGGLTKEEIQKIEGNVSNIIDEKTKEDYLIKIKSKLSDWLNSCQYSNPKILVTYDSLKHVVDVLGNRLERFNIVIDEFQSVFVDSSFKADTELDFVQLLKQFHNQNVLYLSATPMLERYLGIVDYFNELPFYKLIWPDSKIEVINIDREYTSSINTSCSKLIHEYKAGIFPRKILSDKSVHYSKELVFFVNSVKTICDLIRKNKLTPEECNIICSQTDYNRSKIKKLGAGFDYGKVPLKGEKNKMFTFCTRTAYLGADFYSDSAFTVICSNINIKTLIVDISLDLPQIVGRQRLDSNVFKSDVKIFYTGKSKRTSDVTLDEFISNEDSKEEKTKIQLDAYNKMEEYEKLVYSEKFIDYIKSYSYTKDYVGVDSNTGFATYNHLAKISSLRSYEISRPDYQEKVLVKRDMDYNNSFNLCNNKYDNDSLNEFIESFRNEFKQDENFIRRMKMYYKLVTEFSDIYQQNIKVFNSIIPIYYQGYMNLLGPDRIKANGYIEIDIKNEANSILNYNEIKAKILINFKPGNKYSSKDVKQILKGIYSKLNIDKAAKASELENYFKLKECKVLNSDTGKWDRGFEILGIKEDII
jgi:hypothetical protein